METTLHSAWLGIFIVLLCAFEPTFASVLGNRFGLSRPSQMFQIFSKIMARHDGCDVNILRFGPLVSQPQSPINQLIPRDIIGVKSSSSNVSLLVLDRSSYIQRLPRLIRKHQQCNFQLNLLLIFSPCSESNFTRTNEIGPLLSQTHSKMSTDRFVFISKCVQHAREVLSSEQVGKRMSFKLAIVLSTSKIELITACLYCDNGNSKILPILNWNDDLLGDTALLNGAHLKVTAPKIAPRLSIGKRSDGSTFFTRGLYKYMLDAFQAGYNISYTAFFSEKGAVGGLDPVKGFTGMMRDVIYDRADIAVSFGFAYDRYPYVEYGPVFESEYLTFSSGKRAPYTSWKALLWTFKPTMWLATWLAFVMASGALYMIASLSSVDNNFQGTFATVFYIFAAFLDQSATRIPSSNAARLLCSCWLLYALVVSNAFREKLFGFLSFPLEIHLPQSFQELASSHFKVGLQFYGGAAYKYIQTSTTPAFVKIATRMSLETDPIRCFTKSLEHDFSCIHYYGAAEFVRARNLSDRHGRSNFVVAPAVSLSLSVSVMTKVDSVLMTKISSLIRSIRDMGLVEEWKRMDFNMLLRKRVRWEMETGIYKENSLDEDQQDHVRALGMTQLLGPFGMLLVGATLAAVSAIKEVRSDLVKVIRVSVKRMT